MKKAAISQLKARLSHYLRLVKSGETVEIQERGVPVAVLSAREEGRKLCTTPPRKDPSYLAKRKFSLHPKRKVDVLALLEEDRRRR